MSDLLLMTNADAANTLSIVAWIILFFILLNVAMLAYTIIRNKRAAAKELKLQAEGPKAEQPKEEKPEKKEKAVFAKKDKAEKKAAKTEEAAEKEVPGQKTEVMAGVTPQPVDAPVRVAKKPKTAPIPVAEVAAQTDADDNTFNMALTDVSNPERRFVAEGKKEYLVGRKPQMDLCIPDDGYVSGTHCKFEIKDGVLYITDLGSSNGTKVNGNRIAPAAPVQLQQNDTVTLGSTTYTVTWRG